MMIYTPYFIRFAFIFSTGGVQSDVAEKLRQIELRLHEVQDVVKAVDFILQILDVMQGNQEQMNDSSKRNTE